MALRYTLRQLEYFAAVGETGSITGASQRVNVSPPTISAGISQLEAELGLKLFVRHHAQGLALTVPGRRLYDRTREVLRNAADLRDLAGELSGSVRGPLAIGCLSTFAASVLPGLRRSFAAVHPDVRITQLEVDQAELFSQLRQARIDMALTYDLALPADLQFEPMLELPPLIAMPVGHPLAEAGVVTIEALAPLPMVLLDLPLSADYFLSFFVRAGVRANIVERTRDIAVMRSLVANGFGYAMANTRPLHDRAPDGERLCFARLAGRPRPMRLGLLTAEGGGQTRLYRAFAGHAAAWIGSARARLVGDEAAH